MLARQARLPTDLTLYRTYQVQVENQNQTRSNHRIEAGSRGGSILKWVTLEFRLIMHEMNRVTQKF